MKARTIFTLSFLLTLSILVYAQDNINNNQFKQLKEELATPNVYRTASGAPGHKYWQQQADYVMEITLDDEKQRVLGQETITYHNNSPDQLTYLWVQLDQNMRAKDSDTYKISTSKIDMEEDISMFSIWRMHGNTFFDGGFKIDHVKDANGKNLPYTINKTMMRIDLPEPLASGEKVSFNIKWWYNINDRMIMGGRSGYEYFPTDKNYLYTIAQFFPRMAVYNEVEGWQNKQFLGRGEFALTFGDYDVKITTPADHVLAATGVLQNEDEVLTATQRERFEKARKTTDKPVLIITQAEAEKAEKSKLKETKTWHYKAENVRDFAFASSRKFIWDAMAVIQSGKTIMAMSYYPKEGNPLWEKYSTEAVAHTLNIYSKHTFDYPYPVAISVHTKRIGMEYPMICFNFGRPEPDGTYTARTKYGMISVIIHEVGHNYFPMIVNSDERQWTWMDEGLNTFLQFLTEQEWERDYPSRRGEARKIVDYMKGDKSEISPIMTNSESIHQFGSNAYAKPATALNILRETVMGRELFDYAFKEYAQRWMLKHPTPADFFRTMEDASGVDLDWFWRGWFYTNDHVDISLEGVKWYRIDTQDPEKEKPLAKKEAEIMPVSITKQRNKKDIAQTVMEQKPHLTDFYNKYNPFQITYVDRDNYQQFLEMVSPPELQLLQAGMNYYEVTFSNIGGLSMPLVLAFTYNDGSTEIKRIPAQIWQKNNEQISKVFVTPKQISSIVLDPNLELADTDVSNNHWPRQAQPTRFQIFKEQKNELNPMQIQKESEKRTNK